MVLCIRIAYFSSQWHSKLVQETFYVAHVGLDLLPPLRSLMWNESRLGICDLTTTQWRDARVHQSLPDGHTVYQIQVCEVKNWLITRHWPLQWRVTHHTTNIRSWYCQGNSVVWKPQVKKVYLLQEYNRRVDRRKVKENALLFKIREPEFCSQIVGLWSNLTASLDLY